MLEKYNQLSLICEMQKTWASDTYQLYSVRTTNDHPIYSTYDLKQFKYIYRSQIGRKPQLEMDSRPRSLSERLQYDYDYTMNPIKISYKRTFGEGAGMSISEYETWKLPLSEQVMWNSVVDNIVRD